MMKISKRAFAILMIVGPSFPLSYSYANIAELQNAKINQFDLRPGEMVSYKSNAADGVTYLISHMQVAENIKANCPNISAENIGVNIHEETNTIDFSCFNSYSVTLLLSENTVMAANSEGGGVEPGGGKEGSGGKSK
jgi:hypothetical protein